MDESTKHTLEHIGDLLVEKVEGLFDWLKDSTSGISLTYRIHCLEKDQGKAYVKIGRRTAALRKRDPFNELFGDEELSEFFSALDQVDGDLSRCKQEREDRLYPRAKAAPAEEPV